MTEHDDTFAVLTGQQEHYLKKELISLELEKEINELSLPYSLRRFGAPFRAEKGKTRKGGFFKASTITPSSTKEIAPSQSEFPILRHTFVKHVRNFPFLDPDKEVEFWQEKVQTFWESFSTKRISTTADRSEETKRKRLAFKIQKLIEIMMSSGIRTASGREKGVQVDDVDLGTTTTGLTNQIAPAVPKTDDKERFMLENAPDGHPINGFEINVVGVRVVQEKKRIGKHSHLEFLVRTRQTGRSDIYVSRRYAEFRDLHQHLLHAFPEKTLPRVPLKNKHFGVVNEDQTQSAPASAAVSAFSIDDEDKILEDYSPRSSVSRVPSETSSSSSASPSFNTSPKMTPSLSKKPTHKPSKRSLTKRSSASVPALSSPPVPPSPSSPLTHGKRDSGSIKEEIDLNNSARNTFKLEGELQRLSLRAFLRSLVTIVAVAESDIFRHFLSDRSFTYATLTPDEIDDIRHRHDSDSARLEEQFKFYQIASQRARELDRFMTEFKRDLIQQDGLSKFFAEIREKDNIADLSPQYQRFAEWARIETAATIYHLFVGQDNASEMLAQTRRIHSMMPYALLKNVIRFSNPVSMMKSVLDLFLAQPFGQKSLLQRILYIALYEDVKVQERAIQVVRQKIKNQALCDRIQRYIDAEQDVRDQINWEADYEDIDIIVAIAKTDEIQPPIDVGVVGGIINSWIAWNLAVDDVTVEVDDQVRYFSNLKSLLKLMMRKRDKDMILSLTGERVTIELLKDVFTMFYQPLVKVYKSASVHNSVTDVAAFVDDLIKTVDECAENTTMDANVLVQKFVDLCERHQQSFYRFVHEVHVHDNGLFTKLMVWIEDILQFLREGPKNTMDMNELFNYATDVNVIEASDPVDKGKLMKEIDAMIEWNQQRKSWQEKKMRDRLREGPGGGDNADDVEDAEADIEEAEWKATIPQLLKGGDFGLRDDDLAEFAVDQSNLGDESEDDDDDDMLDPVEYERRARLRRSRRGGRHGEPMKPEIVEIPKLLIPFVERLRVVLS
ncbi:hypothetical protein V1512DRAFT_259568 [Lipomyces arxii]|uniref:uncharacterized protein n=1 Tax=Lipomyces arxii TaxID=56418 RepID=UPI0034D0032F